MEVSALENSIGKEAGAGQAEELQAALGRPEKGGLSGKNIKEVRGKATQITGAEPCMAGEIGMCSVHLRKCKEASVPGAGGGWGGSRGQIERTFFGFCSEHSGSHRRALSGGRSWSGWWVGNRPQGPE